MSFISTFPGRVHRKLKKILNVPPPPTQRQRLAHRFLQGSGIEIGALHAPLEVPATTRVTYVDRFPASELNAHYPELGPVTFRVDVIDDGEKLAKFGPASQDFIVANHFLEHAQDPIRTIKRHLEILKTGGVLFMAVPDKTMTFDSKREPTTIQHFLKDHAEGPACSYDEHVEEYARLVDNLSGQALADRVADIKRTDYSIHFHVWTEASLRAFFAYLQNDLRLNLKVLAVEHNPPRGENIVVVRKT